MGFASLIHLHIPHSYIWQDWNDQVSFSFIINHRDSNVSFTALSFQTIMTSEIFILRLTAIRKESCSSEERPWQKAHQESSWRPPAPGPTAILHCRPSHLPPSGYQMASLINCEHRLFAQLDSFQLETNQTLRIPLKSRKRLSQGFITS